MNERSARRTIPFVFATVVAQVLLAPPAAATSMSTDCAPFSSGGAVRLYVVNKAAASPQTLDNAMLETSAIWATAGLRLTWTLAPAALDPTDNRTVFVMIQRELERPPTESADASNGAAMPLLGQVPFGEHGPGNLIQVSFEAITSLVMRSSYLNRPVATFPHFLQQVLVGRALGRVVAHEIGHWLVGRGHMHEGLMKRALGDRDLVESNHPRLPRAWTAAGAGVIARPLRCDATTRGD